MGLRLKHLLCAVCALALLCALSEIGLRVYDSTTGQLTRGRLYDRGLICKSWFCHHTLKPSQSFAVRHPDNEKRIKITLNSYGLRGPEPSVPKPPGVYRILCLGDDVTFAPQVVEAETFCAKLTEQLRNVSPIKIEVLNAGVPDYCPLLSYLQLKHQLLALQPDLVILNFDMSDIADDYQFRRFTAMDADGEPLSCQHPDLDLPKSMQVGKLEDAFLLPEFLKSRARCLWSEQAFREKGLDISCPTGKYRWLADDPPNWSVHIEQAFSGVTAIQKLVATLQGDFVVAVHPAPWQVSEIATDGPGVRAKVGVEPGQKFASRQPFETLADSCRVTGIPCCDASPGFINAESPEELYFKHAAAFSPEGHSLYATELARFLVEERIGLWGRGAFQPSTIPEQAEPDRHAAVPRPERRP